MKAKKLVEPLTLSEDELFEMANFHPRTTGLRHVVWFSGDPVTRHHRPRGKINVGGRFYPFSLDEPVEWLAVAAPRINAKDFADLNQFVQINRVVLLDYWNGKIDTNELVRRLRPVPSFSSVKLDQETKCRLNQPRAVLVLCRRIFRKIKEPKLVSLCDSGIRNLTALIDDLPPKIKNPRPEPKGCS